MRPHPSSLTARASPIAQPYGEPPLENQEEVIRIVVLVPYELTFDFGHHDVVVVELRNGPRRPVVVELGQFLSKIDLFTHGSFSFDPRSQHPQPIFGQRDPERRGSRQDVTVELHRDLRRPHDLQLFDLPRLDVGAFQVPAEGEVTGEGEGGGAAAAAKEHQVQASVVQVGFGGHAERAGVVGDVTGREVADALAAAVEAELDLGVVVNPPLVEAGPGDGGLAEALLGTRTRRSGRIPRKLYASASSPEEGILGE